MKPLSTASVEMLLETGLQNKQEGFKTRLEQIAHFLSRG